MRAEGYAGSWGFRRKAGKLSRWAKGYVLGTPGFPGILRSVQVRETQAAGDLKEVAAPVREWLCAAAEGRGWGLGTRYLGGGGAINASRLSGGADRGENGRRAVGLTRGSRERPPRLRWGAGHVLPTIFPRRRRPTLAALPWLRLGALSGLDYCAAGAEPEGSAPGALARRPWPEGLRSPRRRPRAAPRPGARPFRSRRRRPPPPPPLPTPAAGRPSSQRGE